ncbi:MAG: thiol reductant ABC exporter subunit CydD [Chloroflexi bacterium]|nr:thiol reductant ABC exporter subunit CydD [Chloroflexota bacterium]
MVQPGGRPVSPLAGGAPANEALRPFPRSILLTIFIGWISGILVVSQAWLLSRVITRVFLAGQGLAEVLPMLELLLAVLVGRAVAALAAEISAHAVAAGVKTRLRLSLVERLLALGPAFTRQERTGELALTALEGVEALEAYFGQYLPQLALAALVPITILSFVFPLDALTGAILLLTAPLIPLFLYLIGSASASLTRRQWQVLSRLSAHFLDTLQGLTTLKELGRSKDQVAVVGQISRRYRDATLGVLRVTFLSALVLEMVGTLSTAIVAVEISLRLLGGRLGYEQALFLLVLAPEFYLPLRTLGGRFHAGEAGVAAARRIEQILKTPLPVSRPARSNLPAAPWTIHFESVGYTYPGSEIPALRDVSFEISPGQRIALVGASGAGKSTLTRLLLGFSFPTGGCITVNGVDLAEISAQEWRRQIAWAPQTPYLFNDTLDANLRLARPNCSREEIESAACLAALDEVVHRLPDGFDTVIGERGTRLSGGESQRLSLARAFLKQAPILILDEPTAHLDPELEGRIQSIVDRLAEGRTVLTIAHRLETVRQADKILVLEGGRVVESGTHSQLEAQMGAYCKLLEAGLGG